MNIVLRPLQAKDRDQILMWRQDPDIAAQMFTDHPIGRREHEEWYNFMLMRNEQRHWMCEVDNRPIGVWNLTPKDEHNRKCSWGCYIGDPWARGKGIGLAADYALYNHAFHVWNVNKLWCEVFTANAGVIAMRQSEGYTAEGQLTDHVWKDGRFRDVTLFGMTARAWASARQDVERRIQQKGIDLADIQLFTEEQTWTAGWVAYRAQAQA